MPTLYVENVPKDLYQALRARARKNRSSIAAEVIALLKDNVPTAAELKRRQPVLRRSSGNPFSQTARSGSVPLDRGNDPRGS